MISATLRRRLATLALATFAATPSAFAQTAGGQLLAALNPAGFDNDALVGVPRPLGAPSFTVGSFGAYASIESVALGADGTGYATVDLRPSGATARGGIVVKNGLIGTSANGIIGDGDRMISGSATGLVAPKGLIVVDLPVSGGGNATFLIVADFGARAVYGFRASASGNAAPEFTISNLGMPTAGATRSVWDVDYDPTGDRLFVASTDGDVLVYDQFSTVRGALGPTRTIVPSEGGAKISVNLHGIDHVGGPNDLIALTDVGLASSATDGQLFTVAGASTASGNTNVRYRVLGGATQLGNPVDLFVDGTDLVVAEKSNNQVQRYTGGLTGTGTSSAAASAMQALPGAESVALASAGRIFATGNPAGVDSDKIVVLPGTLTSGASATLDGLGTLSSLESVAVGASGATYVSADGRTGFSGAVVVLASTPTASGTGGTGTRLIQGSNTGLVTPKGVVVHEGRNLLLVCDTGSRSIRVFDVNASGNVAPRAVVSNLGMTGAGAARAPWDASYDVQNDRLFAAGTDGDVVVFDNFSTTLGASGPNRTFTPAEGGAKISVNLHGIEYVGGSESLLLLTDVGLATSATDGQVFTLTGASTATGLVNVRYRNSGAASMLGNPVDLVWDGTDMYVAEKANNQIHRYANVRALTGSVMTAPTETTASNAPEGLAFSMPVAVANEAVSAPDADFGAHVGPNPAQEQALVRVTLGRASALSVTVHDLLGRTVATLAAGETRAAGDHRFALDASLLASGMYVVRIATDGRTESRALAVVR